MHATGTERNVVSMKNKAIKWARAIFQPVLPIGDNRSLITGSKRHVAISHEAALEGTVLLKNENRTLPLKKGAKVAMFGIAQADYVKVGGGSGNVYSEYHYNLIEALDEVGINLYMPLSNYYAEAKKRLAEKMMLERNYVEVEQCRGKLGEVTLPTELVKKAREFTDTAIITICRFSTESEDRFAEGDPYFTLSREEADMVSAVSESFERVILLLNTGAMIDTSWFASNERISAAMMMWQGGMEGALAAAELLVGDATPSGKLVDTCAKSLYDYPSTAGYHESPDYVQYSEDIFVGYRYFETIPSAKEKVVYPFGYGLSYTQFEYSDIKAAELGGKINLSLTVRNVGEYSGKEVVEIYYSAPRGKLTKPKVELAAFGKTKLLAPGESEVLTMSFELADMSSYDDMGEICKSAWVMEKGEYKIYAAKSVRDLVYSGYSYVLNEDTVTSRLTELCAPERLEKRMLENGEYLTLEPRKIERKQYSREYLSTENTSEAARKYTLEQVYEGKITLDEFVDSLTGEEMATLLYACPNTSSANTGGFGNVSRKGIPAFMTADGPAGLRIADESGIRTTAFPVETMLACTWNTELLRRVAQAAALECKENNIYVWLAPALNIHRSPLCGRNFEYFSEDPLISGTMAAAMIDGVQAEGIAATPKHFACNNKETNRKESDSILSERALREIYLKGFEILVKKSHPKVIMTSYNIINGTRSSELGELITGILRGEWGYDGLVITDWSNHASHEKELRAGNDVRTPNEGKNPLLEKYKAGEVSREEMSESTKRLLTLLLWFE